MRELDTDSSAESNECEEQARKAQGKAVALREGLDVG